MEEIQHQERSSNKNQSKSKVCNTPGGHKETQGNIYRPLLLWHMLVFMSPPSNTEKVQCVLQDSKEKATAPQEKDFAKGRVGEGHWKNVLCTHESKIERLV